MKAGLKYFILGLGTGIILTSLVFAIIYSFNNNNQYTGKQEGSPATPAPSADSQEIPFWQITTPDPPQPAGEPSEAPVAEAQADPDTALEERRDNTQPVAQPEILAKSLAEDPLVINQQQDYLPPMDTIPEAPPPDQMNPQPETDGTHVVVTFTAGMVAEEYAQLLQDSGVIDDAAAFNRFISENNLSRTLNTGEFLLPLNGDYDDVLSVICRSYNSRD